MPPPAPSGVAVTTRLVRAMGWQSGIRSEVFLPAMTPASSATPRTSPFGVEPSMTRLSVSWLIATNASAPARRSVIGFEPTSTIRGRPERSTWVRRRRSARGAVRGSIFGSMPPSCDTGSLLDIEPQQVDGIAGTVDVDRLGDDRQGLSRGQRREDVAPLPCLAPGESEPDPACGIALRRTARVVLGPNPDVRPSTPAGSGLV